MAQQGTEVTTQEFDQVIVLVKDEASYSDDSGPVAADYVELIGRPQAGYTANKKERDIAKLYWGHDKHEYSDLFSTLSGTAELRGAGAAGNVPNIGALLRACGMAETVNASTDVQYAPASAGLSSVSAYYYDNAEVRKIAGMRGNAKFMMTAGDFAKVEFSMTGLFALPVTAGSVPTVAAPSDAAPLIVNYANTLTAEFFGEDIAISDFDFDPANLISPKDRPGELSVRIKDRKPVGNITFPSKLLSVQDVRDIALARTTGAIKVVHGVTAGQIVQADLWDVQMDFTGIEDVDIGENEKGWKIPFDVLPNGGDNEFLLTIK